MSCVISIYHTLDFDSIWTILLFDSSLWHVFSCKIWSNIFGLNLTSFSILLSFPFLAKLLMCRFCQFSVNINHFRFAGFVHSLSISITFYGRTCPFFVSTWKYFLPLIWLSFCTFFVTFQFFKEFFANIFHFWRS